MTKDYVRVIAIGVIVKFADNKKILSLVENT